MNRRNFMLYSAMLGLTLPFLPKKEVQSCRRKWAQIGKITIQRVEYIPGRAQRDPVKTKTILVRDRAGKFFHEKVDAFSSVVQDNEYFPYEEYVKWAKTDPVAVQWGVSYGTYTIMNCKQTWLEWLENHQCSVNYHVFENDLCVGMLILHKDYGCVQFKSYILDELMTLSDEDSISFDEDFEDARANPLKTAIICVKHFRKKAKKVLLGIVGYYNLIYLYGKNP